VRKTLWFVALFAVYTAHATITHDVEKIIRKFDPDVNIGVEVYDLTTNKTLYKKNNSRWFIPASNMKLFSDAAALIMLGPDYRFSTTLYTDALKVKDRVLYGNIYLVFSGDPSFNSTDVDAIIQRLRQMGVGKVAGNWFFVNQAIATKPYAPGWMNDDITYGYGAPLMPFSIDANRLNITINPATIEGNKALIEVNDQGGSITLKNLVITRKSGVKCRLVIHMDNANILEVKGCIGQKSLAREESLAIKNPLLYAKKLTQHLLVHHDIQLNGAIKLGVLTKHAKPLVTHTSVKLANLMADTLKPSDNLYADSLFLKVGQMYFKKPATWTNAQVAVKRLLKQYTGINLTKSVLVDGSGLSRYDLITPRQTVALLKFLHNQFPISYEFITALPIAGRDGTLGKRFLASHQKDLVRAKTGGMLGIVSLSGYLSTANNHLLAFSIMVNGISGSSHHYLAKYRLLEDTICDYFLKIKPRNRVVAQKVAKLRRLLPYEKRLSDVLTQKTTQRVLNNIEYGVKHALLGKDVTIARRQDSVLVESHEKKYSQLIEKTLNQLKKKYKFYLEIKGANLNNTNIKSQNDTILHSVTNLKATTWRIYLTNLA
jgi:serine-type D-Ala-D-Ala carboxypeptidase/endopeptidase (penicillin-binding protein 4)